MTQYATEIDLANRNTSHTLVAELVGSGHEVLDVGCSTGFLAATLRQAGNAVSGFEIDSMAAEVARPLLDELVVGDLDHISLSQAFVGRNYDRIIMADVLEHVVHSGRVLDDIHGILAPQGKLVISVPNVAHGALRLALLQGKWRYTPIGLLDNTHVRFYTLESLVDFLADHGYEIQEAWATLADPFATEIKIDGWAIPEDIVEWVRDQETSMHYQYIISAISSKEPSRVIPEVNLPVPIESVRHKDSYTEFASGQMEITLQNAEKAARILELTDRLAKVEDSAVYKIGNFMLMPIRLSRMVLRRIFR